MFKPLFTVATLFLLAATPGECTTVDAAASSALEELGKLTVAEKIEHYQSLTDLVTSSADGLGLGNSCMAHHLFLIGPGGITKSAAADQVMTFKGTLGKITAATDPGPLNWTEGIVSGLVAIAKADVYVLKQIVDTSKKVLDGVKAMEVVHAAANSMATTTEADKTKISTPLLTDEQKTKLAKMKSNIETTLRANAQNAIRVLPAVEDAIFGYAVGNSALKSTVASDKGFNTSITDEANNIKTGKAISKLAVATATMIGEYFMLLTNLKETGTGLTGMTVITDPTTAKGATSPLTGTTATFTAMNDYQKAFVAYVEKVAKTDTGLKGITAADLVKLSSAIAQITPTEDTKGGKTLGEERVKYIAIEKTTIDDGSGKAAAARVICGRLGLGKITIQTEGTA